MNITVLTENTSLSPEIGCEHGLSLYIETDQHKILFDMGQTNLFYENAKKLEIDLEDVDIAVLSHGHYDHGGGLKKFLEINDHAPVYINRYAFEPHYNGTEKYIGVDTDIKSSTRLIFTDNEYKISEQLTLYSCNDRNRQFEINMGGLNFMQNGKLIPEDFRHEQYLNIIENGKSYLISGCSHKGILNIMEWFRPDYLIGGFHFMKRECTDDLKCDAELLDKYKTLYYTCHCTGVEQYEYMKPFIHNLHYISSGQTILI